MNSHPFLTNPILDAEKARLSGGGSLDDKDPADLMRQSSLSSD